MKDPIDKALARNETMESQKQKKQLLTIPAILWSELS